MRKLDFCLCENKGADQLRSNCEADQRLCFRYTDSAIPLLLKTGISCDCTGLSVSGLVGKPEDRFSRVAAQVISDVYSAAASAHGVQYTSVSVVNIYV